MTSAMIVVLIRRRSLGAGYLNALVVCFQDVEYQLMAKDLEEQTTEPLRWAQVQAMVMDVDCSTEDGNGMGWEFLDQRPA